MQDEAVGPFAECEGLPRHCLGLDVFASAGVHLRLHLAGECLGRDVFAVPEAQPLLRPSLRLMELAELVKRLRVVTGARREPRSLAGVLEDPATSRCERRRRSRVAGEQLERDGVLREIRAEVEEVAALLVRQVELRLEQARLFEPALQGEQDCPPAHHSPIGPELRLALVEPREELRERRRAEEASAAAPADGRGYEVRQSCALGVEHHLLERCALLIVLVAAVRDL